MKRDTLSRSITLLIVLFVFILSCKKETNDFKAPFNPYDTISYGGGGSTMDTVDSTSFLGLHKYIFSVKCAQPACHDGAFEPDFRTVQSAYNTLVYHPVVKNSGNSFFTYRVAPGDTEYSWLHERITTNDTVLGRMPLYDTLYPAQIQKIEKWILDGARDIFGSSPLIPNQRPAPFGIVAYYNDTNGVRIDTARNNFADPFRVQKDSVVNIWFGFYDQNDNGDTVIALIPSQGYTDQKVKFSVNNPTGFSSVPSNDLNIILNILNPYMAPALFGSSKLPYYLHYTINTSSYNVGDVVYMRIYIQDQSHPDSSEFPEDGSQFYLMLFFSFQII